MSQQRILIVTNTTGLMVISLKNQLGEHGYEAIIAQGNMKELGVVKDELEGILLYLDSDLANDNQVLVYLRDQALEKGIPFFLIGDQSEIEDTAKTIPTSAVQKVFTRPVNVGEASEEIAEYMKEHGRMTKKKVLVVDDSGAMLRNVKGWLEDKYQVILANSGAMAIKYLSLNRPDLVLLDYEMPVVDGRQVLEMIRSEMDFADIPVVFLTSKNDKESVANVVKLKPEGYLLKTMKPEEIVRYVDDFFEKQKTKQI